MTPEQEARLAALRRKQTKTALEAMEQGDLVRTRLREQLDDGTWSRGRWRYSPEDPPALECDNSYDITLERLSTGKDLAGWLMQLSDKSWPTAEDLGNLVLAVRDLQEAGILYFQRDPV